MVKRNSEKYSRDDGKCDTNEGQDQSAEYDAISAHLPYWITCICKTVNNFFISEQSNWGVFCEWPYVPSVVCNDGRKFPINGILSINR